MSDPKPKKTTSRINTFKVTQVIISILFLAFLGWRLYTVIDSGVYGPDTWVRFALSGLIIGSVYAVIAIGYTLVYGILFMINFAHGEIMMIGAFSGYFVFEALKSIPVAATGMSFLDSYQIISVVLAFIVGMFMAALSGYFLGEDRIPTPSWGTQTNSVDQRHWCFNLPAKRCPGYVRTKTKNVL